MSTTRLEINQIDKVDDTTPKVTRSGMQRRSASASGVRSKIPTILNQNISGSLMTDSQVPISPHDTKASFQGKSRHLPTRSPNTSLQKKKNDLGNSNVQKTLERQFKNKQYRYLTIQNEIQEKQKNALDIFEEVSVLRKKIIASGGKDPGKLEGIKLICDHSNKSSENENPLRENGEYGAFINASVTKEFASILENELRDYPKECVNLCDEIIEKHSELVEWINNLCQDKSEDPVIKEKIDQDKKEVESMKVRLEVTKSALDDSNVELIRKIIIMWEEIEGSRLKIRDLETMSNEVVQKLRMQLNAEMEKFNQLKKEQRKAIDNELKKANTKIQNLEETIAANENELRKYQEYIKSLETQIKQNNVNFERETRDLHVSLKNSEEMIINLESQRNNLESRLMELTDDLNNKHKNDVEKDVSILNAELMKHKDLITTLKEEKLILEEDLKNKLQKENDLMHKLEEDYKRLQHHQDTTGKKFKHLEEQFIAYNIANTKMQCNEASVRQNGDYHQEILLVQRKNMDLEANLNFVKNQMQVQEQTLREQYQRIQVQDELINYLKNNEKGFSIINTQQTQQISREIAAKSETIQALSSELATKELHVTRLEKLVKQMEDQEDRAQEQRTRLERRIAQLELTLQADNNKNSGYVMDYLNSSEKHQVSVRSVSSSSAYRYPLNVSNSKTYTLNSPCYNDLNDERDEEVIRTLDLERQYEKYRRKSRHIDRFYKWLIQSKDSHTSRHSHTRNNSNNNNNNHHHHNHNDSFFVNPSAIDINTFAYQIVDQCAREFESLHSDVKHKSAGCSHYSRKIRYKPW